MILKINNIRFDYFVVNSLRMSVDSIAGTFTFTIPFDSNNLDHILLFKPLRYFKAELFDNDTKIFTGTILNHAFVGSPDKKEVVISGYSLSGILEDCPVPVAKYPLQINEKNLSEISKQVCGYFGIGVIIDSSANSLANEKYTQSQLEADETVKEFLSKLCALRNLILSNTANGEVLITKLDPNKKAIANINENDPVIVEGISLSVNGQAMHRTISVISDSSIETKGKAEETVINKMVDKDSLRATTKVQNSGDENQTPNAAKSLLASQLKNITFSFNVLEWELNGVKPLPGDVITLTAPSVFLFDPTRLVIGEVDYLQSPTGKTMNLSLLLPEAYTGENIQDIFDKTRQV
jgi:prophage tail gpP-like protein